MDNQKPTLSVVSFSGGKDSTAMLLKMLEMGMQVDVVLFCDTELEFEQLYEHIRKVEENTGMTAIGICPVSCKVIRIFAV